MKTLTRVTSLSLITSLFIAATVSNSGTAVFAQLDLSQFGPFSSEESPQQEGGFAPFQDTTNDTTTNDTTGQTPGTNVTLTPEPPVPGATGSTLNESVETGERMRLLQCQVPQNRDQPDPLSVVRWILQLHLTIPEVWEEP